MRERGKEKKEEKEVEKRWENRKKHRIKKISAFLGSQWCSIDPLQLVSLVVKVPQKAQNLVDSCIFRPSGNAPAHPPGQGPGSCSRLWICCIFVHQVQSCGAKPQEWVWGVLWGVFDGLWHPLLCLSLECPMDGACGVEGSTAGPVCVREDESSVPLTRGYTTHSKPPSPHPISWGGFINLASVGSPTPNPARDDSQCSCWVWLLVDAFLSLSLVCFSLDLSWLNNSVPFILSRQLNLQSKVPVRIFKEASVIVASLYSFCYSG